ncbi:MAG: Rpn family recombination-promoting nuclease/putative transposase [Bacteroidia bacterium]|nr:Rpn family recombination-promoting nuclease/putative transposase [Bacteroidia bacterium]
MKKTKKLIRFDWAMKKLLRHKANFDILEGFLTELLNENIKIKQILESEGNKETQDDKHNRVDMLVENGKGELVIIEVQNSQEYDYFHRILFGSSKAVTEYIKEGEPYASVKKVVSITIAYFDLGQGKDYVYHGTTSFKGIHKNDVLDLSDKQRELYKKRNVHEIFPEYWLIKVSKFRNRVTDKLDEWIYFLKNGEVQEGFSAKGLPEAKEKLDEMKMSETDRKAYQNYLKRLRDIASEQHTKMADAEELIKKGREEKELEAVIGFYEIGVEPTKIAAALKISVERTLQIIENYKNK